MLFAQSEKIALSDKKYDFIFENPHKQMNGMF